MRIYVAGAYALRDQLRAVAAQLTTDGHVITSTWLQGTHPITAGTVAAGLDHGIAYITSSSAEDLAGIRSSDVLLLFTGNAMREMEPGIDEARLHTGGRHVETGYALALGKRIVVVGEPENIFHRLVDVMPDFETARELMLPNPYLLRPIRNETR